MGSRGRTRSGRGLEEAAGEPAAGPRLADLPEKQRALIERAYYGDLSHRKSPRKPVCRLGTIKSRIRLALERLRHQMS